MTGTIKMKKTWTFVLWAAVLCMLPLIASSDYSRPLCINALIYAMLAQGLNLCLGYCGQLSLGQAGFYAIGGYSFAILTTRCGFPWWETAAIAVTVTAAAGFLLAAISMRSRGSAFIVISILFAQAVGLVALNWTDVTNGQAGILGVPGLTFFGVPLTTKLEIYYEVLSAVLVMQFLTGRLVDARFGRAFSAIRHDETLADSLGIPSYRYSVAAFTLGAAVSAMAGCFQASFAHMVSPEMADFNNVMLYLIMMVVVGGRGTLWGPVLGAFIFTFLPEYLRFAEHLRITLFGTILVLLVLFVPDGLLPAFGRWRKKSAERTLRCGYNRKKGERHDT